MIDYELFEKLLAPENNEGYIDENDILEQEFFDRMKKFSKSKIERLFKKHKFQIKANFNCVKCGKKYLKKYYKKAFLRLFWENNHICEDCKKQEQLQQQINNKNKTEKEKLETPQRTLDFIKNYLNPSNSWKPMKHWEKIKILEQNLYNTDQEYIKDYIHNQLNYSDFLYTPYWKAISEHKKNIENFKCQFCNSTLCLSVHHKTYKNHGDELHHLDDLVCICQNCHKKLHFN